MKCCYTPINESEHESLCNLKYRVNNILHFKSTSSCIICLLFYLSCFITCGICNIDNKIFMSQCLLVIPPLRCVYTKLTKSTSNRKLTSDCHHWFKNKYQCMAWLNKECVKFKESTMNSCEKYLTKMCLKI